MKKRFTLLFAALLAFVGVAKADFTLSYDKAFWTVPATNHEKVTEVPADVFTAYNNNYSGQPQLAAEKVGVHAKDVNVTGGTVTIKLQYVSGNGSNIRLDICGADLVATDGTVKYHDYHFGYTGGNSEGNTYTLSEVEDGSYTLRVFVPSQKEDFTNGSNNSRGTITVTGAKIHAAPGVVTSIEDLSNDKLYTIVPKEIARGAMYATSTSANLDACGGTLNNAANSGVAIDAAKAEQQFAIYKHNQELFLYSVGAGKFVSDISGNLFPLVETPRHNIALEVSAEAGYFIIKAKGTEYINVSTGHAAGCVGGWNREDDGNRLQIKEVADMTDDIRSKLTAAFAAAEAALAPEVSTAEAPKYYTIGSYNRGGFLTNMGSGKDVEHVSATTNSLWYFTKANDNGGVYICNKNGGYLDANKQVSENKAIWYVLSNGVNLDGAVISSAKPISGNCCIDANNTNTGVGGYAPQANDWQGTTWVFVESNVVTYKFAYGDKKITKEVIVAKGAAYPDYGLPYGLVAAQAKPEGVVDGDKEVSREIAFSFPVSNEKSTKAVMIGAHNGEALLWRAEGNGVTVKKDAAADSENYYWAIYPTFADNNLTYTIKNLGTGKYIYSTSNADSHGAGVVTLADEGSVFTLESANQFKLATGKYLSINSATSADVQNLGTHASHGGTKNKFVAYPGLDEEIKAAFMEQVEACSSLYENYEEALEKLEALDGKMEQLLAVVEPIYDAIEAGDFVKEATVETATESMATAKEEIEPVLAYFNGDYKTAVAEAQALLAQLEEGTEDYTTLTAAIEEASAVAEVTAVAELAAKVVDLNAVVASLYDLSEVKGNFETAAGTFAEFGKDNAFEPLSAIQQMWADLNASVEELSEDIAANEKVLKSVVEKAIQDMNALMTEIGNVLSYYNNTFLPAIADAEALLESLEDESKYIELLTAAIAEASNVETVTSVAELEAKFVKLDGVYKEVATGINTINVASELVIYDLSGRRVEKMEKGIYIVNGVKVVIK